jgi:hypothetical protein
MRRLSDCVGSTCRGLLLARIGVGSNDGSHRVAMKSQGIGLGGGVLPEVGMAAAGAFGNAADALVGGPGCWTQEPRKGTTKMRFSSSGIRRLWSPQGAPDGDQPSGSQNRDPP